MTNSRKFLQHYGTSGRQEMTLAFKTKLGLFCRYIRLATALPVLKNHLRTTAHIDARNHKWIQCEHRCFTVYGTQVFRVVSVLLSMWKRKSVLVETDGR